MLANAVKESVASVEILGIGTLKSHNMPYAFCLFLIFLATLALFLPRFCHCGVRIAKVAVCSENTRVLCVSER